MTHTLRPSIRVCLILVKDIKLWWVPALTSPLPSFVEDSTGFIRYVHPSDSQQEMTHKCKPKCWHQADTASSQNASHPFWQFLLLVIHNKRWHVSAGYRRKSTSRMGEEQQGTGTAEGGGKTRRMYCWVTAAEAGGGRHYSSTGSLLSVSC